MVHGDESYSSPLDSLIRKPTRRDELCPKNLVIVCKIVARDHKSRPSSRGWNGLVVETFKHGDKNNNNNSSNNNKKCGQNIQAKSSTIDVVCYSSLPDDVPLKRPPPPTAPPPPPLPSATLTAAADTTRFAPTGAPAPPTLPDPSPNAPAAAADFKTEALGGLGGDDSLINGFRFLNGVEEEDETVALA